MAPTSSSAVVAVVGVKASTGGSACNWPSSSSAGGSSAGGSSAGGSSAGGSSAGGSSAGGSSTGAGVAATVSSHTVWVAPISAASANHSADESAIEFNSASAAGDVVVMMATSAFAGAGVSGSADPAGIMGPTADARAADPMAFGIPVVRPGPAPVAATQGSLSLAACPSNSDTASTTTIVRSGSDSITA